MICSRYASFPSLPPVVAGLDKSELARAASQRTNKGFWECGTICIGDTPTGSSSRPILVIIKTQAAGLSGGTQVQLIFKVIAGQLRVCRSAVSAGIEIPTVF
jgi:hypothetical protein